MNSLLNGRFGPLNWKSNSDPNGYRVGASEFRGIIRIMQSALKDAGYYNSAIYGLFGDGTLGAMEKLMLENQ
jgi:hypothetical protein